MSESWTAAKNGWYIKVRRHMTSGSNYQKINLMNACRSVENGEIVTFAHVMNGQETECRTYVSMDAVEELVTGNAKLRELLQRTWDAFHDATAREFDTVKNELRKLGIEVGDERPATTDC